LRNFARICLLKNSRYILAELAAEKGFYAPFEHRRERLSPISSINSGDAEGNEENKTKSGAR
jgi:hypothetical protein